MPDLLRYFYVAGLGRRVTGPADLLQPRLIETLKSIAAAEANATPIAIASGAAGADHLFLSAALTLGWSIKLVLPTPVHLFEKDFTTKDAAGATVIDDVALAEFRRLKDAAIDIEVIPPSPERRGAFTRCANQMIADADVLVALWDGKPGKQGGTNESLLLSHQLGVPLVLLDAATGLPWGGRPLPDANTLAKRHRTRYPVGDTKNGGILRHVETSVAESLANTEPTENDPNPPGSIPEFLARSCVEQRGRFGSALASRASALAVNHRDWNLTALLLHVLATAVGLVALVFQQSLPEGASHQAAIIKFLLVFMAVVILLAVRWQRNHHRWVRARFVREINRSLTETALLSRMAGESIGVFVPEAIWAIFLRLRQPLLTFHALAASELPTTTLAQVLAKYRERRLTHRTDYRTLKPSQLSQQDYQRVQAEHAHHRHQMITIIFWGLTGVLLVCAVAGVFVPHESDFYGPVKLGTVLLPVVVAALMVVPNLHDTHRRFTVGPALVSLLARLDGEMQAVEEVLRTGGAGPVPGTTVSVWTGSDEERAVLSEAWARQRAVEIAREAENALLAEVIGFKTFVESVEVG